MSAQHAGTRKWQKIINHEKKDNIKFVDSNYNDSNILNANVSNDFNICSSSSSTTTTFNNFQNSPLYQVF